MIETPSGLQFLYILCIAMKELQNFGPKRYIYELLLSQNYLLSSTMKQTNPRKENIVT